MNPRPVAKRLKQPTHNRKILGSIPSGPIADVVESVYTADLKSAA